MLPPTPPGDDYTSLEPIDNSAATGSSHGVQRFFTFLKRFWWIPFITVLLGMGGAAAYVYWAPPVFVSSSSMWETEKLHLSGGALSTDEGQNYIGTQIELLKSGKLWVATMDRLRASSSNAIPLGKDGQPMGVKLAFKEAPKSDVFSITASSANPGLSRNFLDALMNEYLEYKKTVRKMASGETATSISSQVEFSERELKTAQDALTSFQRTNNLAILQEEGSAAGDYLAKLETQLSDLTLESQILAAAIAQANGSNQVADIPGGNPETSGNNSGTNAETSAGSTSGSAAQEVVLLKMEREKLSHYLRPKHPKIVALDEKISRGEEILRMVRRQNHDQLVASAETVKLKMGRIVNSIKEWRAKVVESSARIAEAEHLKMDVNRAQSLYDRLALLLQNVDISRNTDLETLAILEPASTPKRSYHDVVMNAAVCVFAGLGLGLGIVFLIERRDDRFTSVIEVNSILGDSIVGMLPELASKGEDPNRLLEANDIRHGYAESYRSLRSALLFLPNEVERPKVFLITSSIPGEGKSTVAGNLARTLALAGSKVLLVDGDLRRGRLHHLLKLRSEPGLSDLLGGSCDAGKVIQRGSLPNLSFIACGKRLGNPGDLFLGSGLAEVMAQWRRDYDYVVIDSSPIFASDDVTGLVPNVDGTLFVVRRGHSSARGVSEALDVLNQRRARVLGVIYNGADTSGRNYRYYKYAEYDTTSETV